MAAPIYRLPVTGSTSPVTTKDAHEAAVQAIADALYAELGAIATGLRPAGAWDAASGTFPDGAVRGSYYFVSGAGIMDAQAFAVGDWLVPLVDDASTSSFSGQWVRGDYSKVVKRVYDDVNALVTSTEASRGNSALWQTRGGLSFRESSAGDELGTEDALTAGGVRLYAINRPQIAPTYLDTTSALLNGLDVSILRGINPARHPAILDTSSADDLTGDLSEFFGNLNSDHGSASIFAPGGLYKADNLDLGSIVLKGSMEKRTTFSPFSSNADYVFKVSTARGAVQNLLLEHDRSFACDAILLEFASGPGTAASTNRWGEFRDLRMDGFLGAGLRGKNCIIESAFQNIYTYRCGDPGAGVASFDLDQPDVNNDHINNLLLRKIWAIFPYWKGIRLQSQKEDATSGASGIRVLTLDDVFVHGHTTAIETEPAPYDMLEIKNFTTLFARNWNFARVPNGKWAAVLDGIRTSEGYGINQTGRRGYLYGMNGSGVGGAQTAGGLNLKNVSDFSYDMLSMDGNFQNGTDVSMDANCARIMRGWIQNAGGRAPVISDASTGSRGWNGSGEYNFGGSRLRGVSGINNARNLAGRISVDDPDISGAVVFSNAEPDTSYRVILTTNRPGVVASYTALGTGGFNVSIARNGDTATVNVDWVVMR